MDLIKYINISKDSRIPKYQQIIDSIIYNISIGNLTMDQKIPSINMFSEEFYLSRDTVEKAYSILKERNIITSIRGKGYYISRTKLISKVNILFLVNKLSSYKLRTYNHFIDAIGANSHTDLHIYHCDETLFLNLLDKNKFAYDYYVIMPHFKTEELTHVSFTENVKKAIQKIPKDKLVLLDNIKPNTEFSDSVEIYQDFENDIYNALKQGFQKIKKYKKIMLIYPSKAVYPYPRRILHGFRKFCVEHKLDFEILNEIYDDMILKKGDLFITIEESDLVNLVKQIREDEFKLGEDIGVISYNDTPLKELLGITVVSTNFKIMGETAAKMILNKEKGKFKVPFNFIDRESV
ncbi:GntR family transcriptional regulator [Polaribacter aestuariivivens]|uniref:GntR family transcriptional regulator n=1 Tax=Polaribacter aestuariivivens TaxID=2304626 RepID=UPI003F499A87